MSSDLYKKIQSLHNLKEAIKEVKKAFGQNKKVEKAEPAPINASKDSISKLKYLGRKKIANGILTHIIGTGEDNDSHYHVDLHLEKYNQKQPAIVISVLSPKGEVLDHSNKTYSDIKEALKAIIKHKLKKTWE